VDQRPLPVVLVLRQEGGPTPAGSANARLYRWVGGGGGGGPAAGEPLEEVLRSSVGVREPWGWTQRAIKCRIAVPSEWSILAAVPTGHHGMATKLTRSTGISEERGSLGDSDLHAGGGLGEHGLDRRARRQPARWISNRRGRQPVQVSKLH
jgi:hypothetical protein